VRRSLRTGCSVGHAWKEGTPADAVGPCGQPPAIVIGQAQAPGAQLAAEAPVFLDQIRDDLPFPASQPAGHDHQQELEGGGVDHGAPLISRPAGSREEVG
jgi:hypothetical protein